jgi:glutamine cyclotransferase
MNFSSAVQTSALLGLLLLVGCATASQTPGAAKSNSGLPQAAAGGQLPRPAPQKSPARAAPVPVYTFEIKQTYPHDRAAFTQGLVYLDGHLWESTGQNGQSSLRKVELKSGRVLRSVSLASEYFGEGMTILKGKVYQLTWQNGEAFVYGQEDFRRLGTFRYAGEGWGLTHDGDALIMSDGSHRLKFLDPQTFATRRVVEVTDNGAPVARLNELEYVRGEVFANVWQEDRVARIDPKTGRVTGWIDLSGLLPEAERDELTDVLNGIAYDEAGDKLFVTGKLWPKLYEIRLVKK